MTGLEYRAWWTFTRPPQKTRYSRRDRRRRDVARAKWAAEAASFALRMARSRGKSEEAILAFQELSRRCGTRYEALRRAR